MTVESTYLNVLQGDVGAKMGGMYVGSWTLVMHKSTSGLRRHAKHCWGDEAVTAADNTQDLESAQVVLGKTKLRDGSITAEFQRVGKGKVTYSHRQHTSTEAR
jgi:hypothetical protein